MAALRAKEHFPLHGVGGFKNGYWSHDYRILPFYSIHVIGCHPVVVIIDSKLTAIDTHMPNAPTGGANQRYPAANNPLIQTNNSQRPERHSTGIHGTDVGPDSQWQCIVTSNTVIDQLVVGVDYMSGSLLNVIYGNRHRVIVFKVDHVHRVQKSEVTEWDEIKGARKCIQLNKTIIMDQNLMAPANPGRLNSRSLPFPAFKQSQSLTAMAVKDIRRAVMTQTKYWSICQRLTHGDDIPGQLWWAECVAGAQHTFSRAVADNHFAFNVCANSYTCVTYKTVGALNQQYVAHNRADSMSGTDAGTDSQWQCIVTSNTATDQLVVGVDYMSGSLLDVIYGNRHRVVVFKVEHVHRVQKSEMTKWDVIKSAHKSIQLNKTIIMDQNLIAPVSHGRLNSRSLPFPAFKQPQSLTAMAMKNIRRAVMIQTKYWSICQRLTHGGDIPGQLWWAECVAGAQHTFSRAVADNRYDKHYLIVKMDALVIILFQKVPDAIVESKRIRAGLIVMS
ncbi:unnamed protein product [Medioppia subpectinata]|uniref:Uncharacterized protein n=1 Tax=Medioppia subpectinata TaxID=1979941 RepID=A0A7R9PU58_9ACAR|nr:unnamed protein product [Medioppia subpectinata]CAG2101219.1 unnamed protein product [Medioppia subpectinata]